MGAQLRAAIRRHPAAVLTLVGLVLFAGAVVWSNHLQAHYDWLAEHGVRTTAQITRIHCSARGGCGDWGYVAFETPQGTHGARVWLSELSHLHRGDMIPIAYDPRNPNDARSLEGHASLPMSEILAVMGMVAALALWVAAAVRVITSRVTRRRRVA